MNRSTNDLKEISEGDDDSKNSGALGDIKNKAQLEENDDLYAQEKLIEIFDIIPTAFCLMKTSATEHKAFRKRFAEMHMSKGMVSNECMPEKHCSHN